MKWPAAVIAILAVSFTTPVFSGPAPTPAPHPEAQRRISLNYRGPLREAVKRVADDAKLNVVVRGDLDEEGDFHFENVHRLSYLELGCVLHHQQTTDQPSPYLYCRCAHGRRDS